MGGSVSTVGNSGKRVGLDQAEGQESCGDRPLVIEGLFGRAVVDVAKPGWRELWLRQPDGSLAPKNLLSLHSPAMHGWAVGGYSYVVGNDGVRYESRRSHDHRAESAAGRVVLSGVKLVAENGQEAPLTENWEIVVTAQADGTWKREELP